MQLLKYKLKVLYLTQYLKNYTFSVSQYSFQSYLASFPGSCVAQEPGNEAKSYQTQIPSVPVFKLTEFTVTGQRVFQ